MTPRVREVGGSRLSRRDLLRVGSLGLHTRRVRAALSALGISIGIAAIVGVLGISQTSKSALLAGWGWPRSAATLLGIHNLAHPTLVWIGGYWFTVAGILDPITAETPMDSMAFVGFSGGRAVLRFRRSPHRTVRANHPGQVSAVFDVLPATVSPASPSQVLPGEPAGILQAEALTQGAYTSLFLGLGAVALLVGVVGIANVMVISVLERRPEIGLRRALGATRRHVGEQFLTEALLLSLLGGLAGTIIGVITTAIYYTLTHTRNSQLLIPPEAFYAGLGAALAIGAVAGLYPAIRAARLSPTEALRTV